MARILRRDSHSDGTLQVLPPEGTVLEGRFELLQLVGSGGMGAVYRALDRQSGTAVAVKLLTLEEASGARRFRREFRAASRLDHPNVVAVHSYHTDERPFFTMEFVPGATLGDWVGPTDGELPPQMRQARIHQCLRQMLDALDYIHGQGYVHRDLKPENVLVTPDAQVKVMDFGVVRGGESTSAITRGRIVGTLAYMAPEQLEGREVDRRADLYSVGAILYELLTGEAPFDDSGFGSLARAILQELPPSPRSLDPTVDPLLSSFAMTLLSKKPWQRFASARDALEVLDQSESGKDTDEIQRPPLLVPQFAGREAELAAAQEALDRQHVERGGLMLVSGEPGLGKTRFLEEVAGLVRAAGRKPYLVRPSDRHASSYAGLRPFLDELAAELSAEPDSARATLAGELAPLLDPSSRSQAELDAGKRAFLRSLASLSQAPHPVLVIDDLERLDGHSFDLLTLLLREMATPPLPEEPVPTVLIIASTGDPHDGHVRTLLEGSTRMGLGVSVELAPFTSDETEAQARSMLGATKIPAALKSWLHKETTGYPQFITQTLRHLVGAGLLVRHRGQLTLNWHKLDREPHSRLEPEDFAQLPLASGMRAVFLAQVDRLQEDARQTLAIAAAIGTEVDFDLLLEATGADEDRLVDQLQALLLAGVLIERFDRPDTYRFNHDRLRDVILDELDPEAYARTHLAIARAIETGPEPLRDPVRLARHYDAAAMSAKAAEYLPRAAAQLTGSMAHDEAANAWSRYLELDRATPAQHRNAQRGLAESLALVRRLPEARAVLGELLKSTEDLGERCRTLNQLSLFEGRLGNFASAISHACEHLLLARAAGDLLGQAEALTAQGSALTNQGQYAAAEASLEEAEALYRQAGASDRLSPVVRNRACVIGQQGRLVEAAALVQSSLSQSRACADVGAEQFAMLELANIHLLQGRLERAIACYEEALELAERLGVPHRAAYTHNNMGLALILAGDYETAEQLIARCLRFGASGHHAGLTSDAHLNRACLRRLKGDLDGASDDVDQAEQLLGPHVHPAMQIAHSLELGRILAVTGRPGESRRAIRSALAIARANRLPWHEASARAELAQVLSGRAALEQAERARELANEMGADLIRLQALAAEARALIQLGNADASSRAREVAERLVRTIARSLGRRDRLFLRTPIAASVVR